METNGLNPQVENKVTSSSDCPADEHSEGNPVPNPMFSPHADHDRANGAYNSLDQETLVFEQCTESGFVPESASGMLSHESFRDLPEQEPEENEVEDRDSTISTASWVQRQMSSGMDPRLILSELLPKGTFIPSVSEGLLWRFILNVLSEPKRAKLAHINTLDDVVHLLRTCRRVIVLTGAGVSVSCGIPDFRSSDGVYARLSKDYPDLPDPQAMFDINYFRRDPRPFFKFAKEIYPGQFSPSPSHKFIRLLEKQDRMLRNYTQNIDTLEHAAGIKNVITCHGSFATATCTRCRHKVDSSVIKDDIFSQRIPHCPACPPEAGARGIMKPDIVFFGEGLSEEFHEALARDKEVCDLLIVMGSSLKVRPVAMIPSSIPTNVPQILINREPLKHLTFDVELLGDCDVIIGELCKRLSAEWGIDEDLIPSRPLREVPILPSPAPGAAAGGQRDPAGEVNNNVGSPAEESNSCDCGGMSAICLEDEGPPPAPRGAAPEGVFEGDLWPGSSRESVSQSIPEGSYLFFQPSRYVFEGAEVYHDPEEEEDEDEEERGSTPTDYSSDSAGSPPGPPSEGGPPEGEEQGS